MYLVSQYNEAGQDDPDWEAKELRRSLWKAPELLRHPTPPLRGTQKGDVYSFAIVLYEIIGRCGPWGHLEMSHAGEKYMCTRTQCFRYGIWVSVC